MAACESGAEWKGTWACWDAFLASKARGEQGKKGKEACGYERARGARKLVLYSVKLVGARKGAAQGGKASLRC